MTVTNAELIHEFVRRSNAADVAGLVELFTDDGSFSMILLDGDVSGRAGLTALFGSLLARLAEHSGRVLTEVVEGPAGAAELRLEAVTVAGRRIAMDALGVFDFRDGRIARLRVYADTAPLREAFP